MTRIFLALELDAATRRHIAERAARLGPALAGARLTAPESWHVTLAFWGEVAAEREAAARRAAGAAARTRDPFTLRAAGVGWFGEVSAPRVVWIGLAGDLAALHQLWAATGAALRAAGFATEDRFSPHITLARRQGPLAAAGQAALRAAQREREAGPDLAIRAISVMRSDLGPAGARYTALERAPLRGG